MPRESSGGAGSEPCPSSRGESSGGWSPGTPCWRPSRPRATHAASRSTRAGRLGKSRLGALTPRKASGRGSGGPFRSTFLGDLLAGPRPRRATEVLADAYAREARLVRQLQLHAEHFGRYPDKREVLADAYAREARLVRQLQLHAEHF